MGKGISLPRVTSSGTVTAALRFGVQGGQAVIG